MQHKNILIISEYPDEWYEATYTCSECNGVFMASDQVKYCPYCRITFKGFYSEREKEYRWNDLQNEK